MFFACRRLILAAGANLLNYCIMVKSVSMRAIFAALVRECGPTEGANIFEWYCKTYGVTITDPAPATVAHEVLGL